jgi:hypothetical protein
MKSPQGDQMTISVRPVQLEKAEGESLASFVTAEAALSKQAQLIEAALGPEEHKPLSSTADRWPLNAVDGALSSRDFTLTSQLASPLLASNLFPAPTRDRLPFLAFKSCPFVALNNTCVTTAP